jgi:hypothetical protein
VLCYNQFSCFAHTANDQNLACTDPVGLCSKWAAICNAVVLEYSLALQIQCFQLTLYSLEIAAYRSVNNDLMLACCCDASVCTMY